MQLPNFNNMSFLSGIQLVNNIQIHAYKNEQQHWLSLFKDDCFIDFVAYGPEISGLTVSHDRTWFAYFQKNAEKDGVDFAVWKYNRLNSEEHEIVPYYSLVVPINIEFAQICFNSAGTHVACFTEWNRIQVVDLRRLDAPTEFYIPNSNNCHGDRHPLLFDVGECFTWFGQDEFVRVIDLTTKHLAMWRDKLLKNTKYLFAHNDRVIHMTDAGIVGVFKVNLMEKRLEICHDIKYPTGKYEDITIDECCRVMLHKKNGETYCIDL